MSAVPHLPVAPPAIISRLASVTAATPISGLASPRSTFSLASSAPRKKVRTAKVTFLVEPHPRTAKRFGRDVFARVLLLRLQGHSVPAIMRELNCSRDFVDDLMSTWETQTEIVIADLSDAG